MKPLEEHRTRLKEIADYAFSHGINSVFEEVQEKGHPSNWSKEELSRFFINCHEGFKTAQKLLIEEVKYYQNLLREFTVQLKEWRRQRNKQKEKDVSNTIKIVEHRLSTLSHIADGIAWQMIGGQIHIARRFHIGQEDAKFLDSSNLKHALEVADKINENPYDFALLSDLTSFMQIGDLLIKRGPFTGIMELKEGKINEQLEEFFKELDKQGKSFEEINLDEHFDQKTAQQARRMQRQKQRAQRALDVINNDKGIDPVSGGNITVSTPEAFTEYYHEELEKLQLQLKSKTWAYTVIDTCLHIGMYRDESIPMAPFLIEVILKEKTKNYIIIDWMSIVDQVSEPIFSKPFTPDFIIDILTGKIRVIMGLDVDALIEVFNMVGVKTRWMTEKETNIHKQDSPRDGFVIVNKRGIVINTTDEKEFIVYGGIISKIFYDTIHPLSVALSLLPPEEIAKEEDRQEDV